MRRYLLLALLAAACAPAGSSNPMPTAGPSRVNARGPEAEVNIAADNVASTTKLVAEAAAVWAVLPDVYREVGIAAINTDAATMTIYNPRHAAQGRMGGVALSTYFNCGESRGGPTANSYALRINISTQVVAVRSGGSEVRTTLEGFARPNDGSSGGPVRCGSNGRLEQRIAELAQIRALAR